MKAACLASASNESINKIGFISFSFTSFNVIILLSWLIILFLDSFGAKLVTLKIIIPSSLVIPLLYILLFVSQAL